MMGWHAVCLREVCVGASSGGIQFAESYPNFFPLKESCAEE